LADGAGLSRCEAFHWHAAGRGGARRWRGAGLQGESGREVAELPSVPARSPGPAPAAAVSRRRGGVRQRGAVAGRWLSHEVAAQPSSWAARAAGAGALLRQGRGGRPAGQRLWLLSDPGAKPPAPERSEGRELARSWGGLSWEAGEENGVLHGGCRGKDARTASLGVGVAELGPMRQKGFKAGCFCEGSLGR